MPEGTFIPPPIPVRLAQFPTVGGLVVPFTTLRHHDGKAGFGLVDSIRNQRCLHEQRCSVCGQVIGGRMIFFMRAIDLARKCSTEPAACPPCAAYTQKACPMVSGYLEHYRQAIAPFITRRCDDESCPLLGLARTREVPLATARPLTGGMHSGRASSASPMTQTGASLLISAVCACSSFAR
jgi:hypothetical protein